MLLSLKENKLSDRWIAESLLDFNSANVKKRQKTNVLVILKDGKKIGKIITMGDEINGNNRHED